MGKRKGILSLLTAAICLCLCFGLNVKAAGNSTELENENFRLQLVNDYSELRITDKISGELWSSSMSDSTFDLSKINEKWKKKMNSLFSVNVTNLARGFGAISAFEQYGAAYTAEEYPTENGFGVTYDMQDTGIKFALEFELTEDGVKIGIPSSSIVEYGETFSLVSIDLMTFFGAATDEREGYFFYPDGSGAVMEFADQAHWNESYKTFNIYGDIMKDDCLLGRFEEQDAEVLLPVFGGNYGETGFVAYITEGEQNARITVNPSSTIVPLNYMYPGFIYRRGFIDPRVTEKTVQTYDKDFMKQDYEICYSFLENGNAEYADMANRYREYLLESGDLGTSEVGEEFPLSLDFFMGIKEEGLIFDTFQSVTTFEQAQEILEDLNGQLDEKIQASLIGWSKGGYGSEPKFFPADGNLGGKSGLKKLSAFAQENGIDLSLTANFLTASAENSGYSKTTDVVFLGNYQVLTNLRASINIMSPNTAKTNFDSFLKKVTDYQLSGLTLENLGSMLYYNYNTRNIVSSTECRQYWQEMLQTAKENFGSVAAQGGNLYTLKSADRVTDIPVTDSGYQMTTKSVPFYQILVHGYVDYTGEALNLSSDSDKLRLKWIEYGYIPYFQITYESAEKLINTDYNELFSSEYSAWRDEILETCEKMEAALRDVRGEAIVSHEEIAEDVYCTGYSNEKKIYVNYNSEAVTVDGVTIEAQSYQILGGN